MKHYGLKIAEGTEITNVTVATGTSFPANENEGELFFRTDNDTLYYYDGTQWQEVGGGALTPTTFYFTVPSDNYTTFSGNDDSSNPLVYDVGAIYVYLNGVLIDPDEYTASSGTSIVLDTGADTGDLLTVLALAGWSGDTIDGGSY